MNNLFAFGNRQAKQLAGPALSDRFFAILASVTAATMAIMVLAQVFRPSSLAWIRFLAVIPLIVAAYGCRNRGFTLILVGFFSASYLPVTLAAWGTPEFGVIALQFISYTLFLAIVGYLAGSIAGFQQTRTALRGAVREREALLDRATDLNQVITFVLQEATATTSADEATLLMQDPVTSSWQAVTVDRGVPEVRSLSEPAGQLTLAKWLVERNTSQLMGDLDSDPRFVDAPTATSLLAQPLRLPDGTPLAILVLLRYGDRCFGPQDLAAIESLTMAGGQAMIQAGVMARIDEDLAKQVRRLTVTQHAASELNASLDPTRIAHETLVAAVEISGATSGLVAVEADGISPVFQGWNVDPDAASVSHLAQLARHRSGKAIDPVAPLDAPMFLSQPASQILMPLHRDQQTLGFIALEDDRPGVFGPGVQRALAGVADQAAIALENASLYEQIVQQKQIYEQIVTSIADALLTVDHDGRITGFNPAAERLTGWRAEEAAGHLLCDVLICTRGEACAEDCKLMAALRAPQIVRDAHWIIGQRAGSQRVVTLSAAPLPPVDGVNEELVVLLHDITERHEIEQFQRDLIGAFSHELRTPLASIIAIADMLADGQVTHAAGQAEYLDILRAESQRLAEFAGKMLDVARHDGGRLSLETRPIPVGLVLNGMLEQWRAAMPERPLDMPGPAVHLWAWADETALETILNTLVDNGNKYSPPGRPVELSIVSDTADTVTVAVQDQGPGIPEEFRDLIFERFYRLDASDAQTVYGHGLGLYLARNLVNAMGGKIWVENGPGGLGSRFCFSLRRVREETLETDSAY
ncbi:MAG: ATP-binding protein [Chloroflexota bacterium]|nr:ATP-binding protein [Chloroflexota bacterium]